MSQPPKKRARLNNGHASASSKVSKMRPTERRTEVKKENESGANATEWKSGDACEVRSHSLGSWHEATVVDVATGHSLRILSVDYNKDGTQWVRKKLDLDTHSEDIRRPQPEESGLYKCICKEPLKLVRIGKKRCTLCTRMRVIRETDNVLWFMCPKGKSDMHKGGFVVCDKCISAKQKPCESRLEKPAEMDKDYLTEQCPTAFAEGALCFVHFACFETEEKFGLPAVVKHFSGKRAYKREDWDTRMKCMEATRKFTEAWNARSDGAPVQIRVVDATTAQVYETGIEKRNRKQRMKALGGDIPADEMVDSEHVVVEDFLSGTFIKWNSNGGWRRKDQRHSAVDAFCHWTYHASEGTQLVCDIQGVRYTDGYVLTDPAILSNETGVFGPTDLGREAIANWFIKHQCTEYCKAEWLKPSQAEMDAVPESTREMALVSSSQQWTTQVLYTG